MGYEVKIFIVEHRKNTKIGEDGWCRVICSVDLSKIGSGQTRAISIKNQKELNLTPKKNRPFFYDFNGNKKINKDRYGSSLPLIPLQEFYDAIVYDNNKSPYRRFDLAISVLKNFLIKANWSYERDNNWLHVMPYGY